ncbi:PadR family transcriptional regulator [Nostoc sp. 106C]|uniref:PadR family transcriptional regulator n=1 Tax=Nostoc sp. 106C TaxID=1932667 RepID=UPI000A3BFCBA|nr:PadR family transcriptional regulator [Nostoc sp. 106C]OUL22256.1 PadR family transcriptional regulator [Nostoc sp. 106C]OUL27023.1 PadR family transcriptional regulator [Nostoc sp. RF31YmG]
MSLTYAILSVLIDAPSSGYDLAKRFNPSVEGSVGFFWSASFQQIYRELNRLEEKEWLQAESVQQENRPDKRIYAVTALGKQQLCQWIAESEEMAPIKDDLLVKLYAGHLVSDRMILAKLEAHRQQHQQRLAIYQEIQSQHFQNPQALTTTLKFQYMTLLRGIHYETGWLAWCDQIMPLLK